MKKIIKFLPENIYRVLSHKELSRFLKDISGRLQMFEKKLVLRTSINKKNIYGEREITFALQLLESITDQLRQNFHLIPQMGNEQCEDAYLIIAVNFFGDFDTQLGRLEIMWQEVGAVLIINNDSSIFNGVNIPFYDKYINY